jgi:peroxiredoxin
MKKMYTILTGLLLPFICIAQSNKFDLTIHTSAVKPGAKAYLFYQFDGNKVVDSSVNTANQFKFNNTIPRPLRASIVVDAQQIGLPALLKSRVTGMDVLQFYIYPGKISGQTQARMADITFGSTGLNADFQVYQKQILANRDQQVALSKQIIAEHDSLKLKLLVHEYDSLKTARMPAIKAFVVSHPNSFIGLMAWQDYNQYLQSQDNYKQLSPAHLVESKALFDQLSGDVKSTDEGKIAMRLFANDQLLKPGLPAPDFAQPDAKGKMVKLSDFKGRYILLDFWASWCGPCRQSSPKLVQLYHQFMNRNFTILGISLDDKEGRPNWLKAIKDDGLEWAQVSDLQHWDNKVVKLYSISAIPQSILIGPDGKIIANSPDMEELKQILDKTLPTGK